MAAAIARPDRLPGGLGVRHGAGCTRESLGVLAEASVVLGAHEDESGVGGEASGAGLGEPVPALDLDGAELLAQLAGRGAGAAVGRSASGLRKGRGASKNEWRQVAALLRGERTKQGRYPKG